MNPFAEERYQFLRPPTMSTVPYGSIDSVRGLLFSKSSRVYFRSHRSSSPCGAVSLMECFGEVKTSNLLI